MLTSTLKRRTDSPTDVGQSFGASSSYSRKYALAGLLLIDDSGLDPDASNDHQPKAPEVLITLEKDTPEWKKVVNFIQTNKDQGIDALVKRLGVKYKISAELKKELAILCSQ